MNPLATFTYFLTGLFVLAVVALVLSSKAKTTDVLSTGGSALAGLINAAVSPVTGTTGNLTTNSAGNALVSALPTVPNFTAQFLNP